MEDAEQKRGTYPALPDVQRLDAPFLAHRRLERAEPRVVQVPEPPVRGAVNRNLHSAALCQLH